MSCSRSILRRLTFALPAAVAAVISGWSGVATALEDAGRYVFVPNRASADIAVIDTVKDEVVARVPVGKLPHQVVVAETLAKLVASNTEDDTISVVDLKTLAVEATIKLGDTPEHMALSPDGIVLAVGNIGAGTVSLVSLAKLREIARVADLIEPHNLTFSPDGTLIYVANLGADHISVLDVAKAEVVNEISVAEPTPLADAGQDSSGEFQGIVSVTRTVDGRLGFAAHGEGNTLAVIDLQSQRRVKDIALGELPWRAYGTADGRFMLVPNNGERSVSVISTASLEVVATLPGAADMTGVNTGWFDSTAFVISRGENKAVVLDLVGMKGAGEIALPGTPETGITTPDGRKLYVALSEAGKVAVIDTRARKVIKMIDGVGEEPWGATMVGAIGYCH
ncbi:MAG: beta-propeller fold lactonase family protein [Rhodospirillales bacterium]|nr:beta-propeller fold lactonase family protein [Rhodospirillales bacterium]